MLPYLTPDFPGVGGVIKQRPEDFSVVESFPLSVNGKVDKRRLAEVVPA